MDSVIKVSYWVVNQIEKEKSKVFTDVEFIKQCMESMVYSVS